MNINELYESMIPVNIELARIIEGISREECIDKVYTMIINKLNTCDNTSYYSYVYDNHHILVKGRIITKEVFDNMYNSLRARLSNVEYIKTDFFVTHLVSIKRVTYFGAGQDVDNICIDVWYNDIVQYSIDLKHWLKRKLLQYE